MTGAELARLYDCMQSYLPQLVDLGMPREPDGSYDIHKAVPWYIKHLRESKKTNEAQAKARKTEAEAALKELELKAKEEGLITIEDAIQELAEVLSAIRAQLLALPSKVASQLIACETAGEAEGLLKKYIEGTLEELSEIPNRIDAIETDKIEVDEQPQDSTKQIS
jgi:phage terminase Nu1 subunit (DNA packaging protein)